MRSAQDIILKPIITEDSMMRIADKKYTFRVAVDANKIEIAKAVEALGEHLGKDGLISYIELGSLGHWGEWHVNYSAGIQRLPNEAVRNYCW